MLAKKARAYYICGMIFGFLLVFFRGTSPTKNFIVGCFWRKRKMKSITNNSPRTKKNKKKKQKD